MLFFVLLEAESQFAITWQVKDVFWKYISEPDKSYYVQTSAASAIAHSITTVKFYHDYLSMEILFPEHKGSICTLRYKKGFQTLNDTFLMFQTNPLHPWVLQR